MVLIHVVILTKVWIKNILSVIIIHIRRICLRVVTGIVVIYITILNIIYRRLVLRSVIDRHVDLDTAV